MILKLTFSDYNLKISTAYKVFFFETNLKSTKEFNELLIETSSRFSLNFTDLDLSEKDATLSIKQMNELGLDCYKLFNVNEYGDYDDSVNFKFGVDCERYAELLVYFLTEHNRDLEFQLLDKIIPLSCYSIKEGIEL